MELKIVTGECSEEVPFRLVWFLLFFSCPLILLVEMEKWIAGALA